MNYRIIRIFYQFYKLLKYVTWPRLAIGFAGMVLLATLGQVVLVTNMGSALGAVLYILAILLFLLILKVVDKLPPATNQEQAVIKQNILPTILILTSLIILVYVLANVDSPQTERGLNYIILISWMCSILLFSLGIMIISRWQFPNLKSIGHHLDENKQEIILVFGLVLLALFLRLYQLDQIPYPMENDEATVGIEVHNILEGNLTNLFQLSWNMDPLLNSLPQVASIAVFGNTIFGVRLAPAILGTLTVLFLYFFSRRIFDKLTALLASLCLLAIPPHLHFSRLGVSNIAVGFWAVLVFWITYCAIKSDRMHNFLLAGFFTGLPLYSYTGSKLISAIGLGMLVVCVLFRRGFLRKQWRNLLVYGLILLIVAAPTLYLSYLHPDTFLARIRGDNIFNNRWLISEPANSGRSMGAALLDQFRISTMVFISLPAWGGFYDSAEPFLLPLAAVLFVLGWGYSLFNIKDPRQLLLQVWFWGIVILGSVIFVPTPSAERMVGSLPVAALFCAIGLVKLMEVPRTMRLASSRMLNGIAVIVMGIASLQGAYYYLFQFQQSWLAANPYEEFKTDVSLYAHTLNPDYRMYMLISMPLEVAHFEQHDFLIPEIPIQQLDIVSADVLQTLPRDKGMVFFAIPDKAADLAAVAQFFPGGEWHEVDRRPIPSQPQTVLYYSYQIPPELTQAFEKVNYFSRRNIFHLQFSQ